MEFNPRRWGWRSLVGAWSAYWAGLATVTLGPFALYVWKMAQLPGGKHATVSLTLGDEGFHLTALREGATAWSAIVSSGALALWLAGPPLAIWLIWLVMRPSPSERARLRDEANAQALSSGPQDEWIVRNAPRAPVERSERQN